MTGTDATPYCDVPTPELVCARDSLALCLSGALSADHRAALEWLHAYATEELARRLSGFVQHADVCATPVALEELAFAVGVVRGPKPRPVQMAPASLPHRRAPSVAKSLLLQQPDGSLKAVSA